MYLNRASFVSELPGQANPPKTQCLGRGNINVFSPLRLGRRQAPEGCRILGLHHHLKEDRCGCETYPHSTNLHKPNTGNTPSDVVDILTVPIRIGILHHSSHFSFLLQKLGRPRLTGWWLAGGFCCLQHLRLHHVRILRWGIINWQHQSKIAKFGAKETKDWQRVDKNFPQDSGKRTFHRFMPIDNKSISPTGPPGVASMICGSMSFQNCSKGSWWNWQNMQDLIAACPATQDYWDRTRDSHHTLCLHCHLCRSWKSIAFGFDRPTIIGKPLRPQKSFYSWPAFRKVICWHNFFVKLFACMMGLGPQFLAHILYLRIHLGKL